MNILSLFTSEYGPIRVALIVAMALIVTVSMSSLYFISEDVEAQKGDAAVLNISGRQRMLTQKMTKEALVLSNPKNQQQLEEYAKKLKNTSDLFDLSFSVLIQGGSYPIKVGQMSDYELPPTPPDTDVFRKMSEVNDLWRPFKDDIDTILKNINDIIEDSTTAFTARDSVINLVGTNEKLLRTMNEAVNLYETTASEKHNAIIDTVTNASYFALALLIIVSFLIYLINRALGRADTASELAQKENEELQENIFNLLNVVSEASEGDLTVRARVSEGSMGNVADAFNQMMEQWNEILNDTTSVAADIETNLAQVLSANENVAQEAQTQTSKINNTNTLMRSMANEMSVVSENATSASDAAKGTMNSAEEGAQSVNLIIDAMRNLQQNVQDGAKKIKGLGDRSMEITTIVSAIAKISDKTNTLALNAAIEAARAGEEGRGFSVVADQVQRLAEQTAESTDEIDDLVKTIQDDAGASVKAIDEQSYAVEKESHNVFTAGQMLEKILEESRTSSSMVERITNITSNHQQSFMNLLQEFEEIEKISRRSQQSSTENLAICSSIIQKSNNLMNQIRSFKLS